MGRSDRARWEWARWEWARWEWAQRDWAQLLTPFVYIALIAVLAVFAHSGLQGEHGLAALHRAEALERELEAELAAIREDRRALENKVERLSTDYLDLELLDERARAVLGYVRRDELVIR